MKMGRANGGPGSRGTLNLPGRAAQGMTGGCPVFPSMNFRGGWSAEYRSAGRFGGACGVMLRAPGRGERPAAAGQSDRTHPAIAGRAFHRRPAAAVFSNLFAAIPAPPPITGYQEE
jgi:hypothetical protein